MNLTQTIEALKGLSSSDHYEKLSRFGIENKNALGVKLPDIRKLAKKIGKNHALAMEIWNTCDVHEALLLAPMIADIQQLTEKEFDDVVYRFNSWDLCDCTCDFLMLSPFAETKTYQYADNESVFVKRTAFVLMCSFAAHDKRKTDEFFYPLLDLVEKNAWDERNFVRKAVNWALRQIGKRNEQLRLKSIETAERILAQNTKSARWIAGDALRELRSEKVINRVRNK